MCIRDSHLSMLEKGIFYLTPHLFHAAISTAHSAKDIDDLVAAVEAFARVAKH